MGYVETDTMAFTVQNDIRTILFQISQSCLPTPGQHLMILKIDSILCWKDDVVTDMRPTHGCESQMGCISHHIS